MRISKFVRKRLRVNDTKRDLSILIHWLRWEAAGYAFTTARIILQFLDQWHCSESDYAHAVNVWQQFSVQTLGEYSDLYLKTDILLLADIFENFRDKCIESYGLDPAYYTLPDFTWDAILKHTRINFELLTDIDIERSRRGGLSQCSSRYTRTNNKYTYVIQPVATFYVLDVLRCK